MLDEHDIRELPLVSILLVHYNRPIGLEKAFYALKQNLTYPNLEFVLSDDCSSAEVLEKIRELPFDKIVTAEKNQGLGANTNKGIKACSGKYILQLQDDHILSPGFEDFLYKGVQVLECDDSIGFVRFLIGRNFSVTEKRKCGTEEYVVVPKAIWKNGERGYYQYSDWPHLKRAELHPKVGYYLEQKPMNFVENEFNIRIHRHRGIMVAFFSGYENIFDTYRAKSNRNTDIKKRRKRSLKNSIKDYFKNRSPLIKMFRFYYWILRYVYNKREY